MQRKQSEPSVHKEVWHLWRRLGRKAGQEASQTAAQFRKGLARAVGCPNATTATGMVPPCLVIYWEQPVGSMASAGIRRWIQKDSS